MKLRYICVVLAMAALLAGCKKNAKPAPEPQTEAAAGYDQSGSCGDAVTWGFNEAEGILVIEGSGEMANYYFDEEGRLVNRPWEVFAGQIRCVQISEGVTSLGDHAFLDCTALTQISIPASVGTLYYQTFMGCPDLVFDVSEENEQFSAVDGNLCSKDGKTLLRWSDSSIESVEIPDGVTGIGYQAFAQCKNLKQVTLPASLVELQVLAFENCPIETWIVDAENPIYSTEGNALLSKDGKTVLRCQTVPSGVYTLPESVTAIGANAFQGCVGLTEIHIPQQVTSVGSAAFGQCRELTEVSLPDGITEINGSVFYGCEKLKTVVLPESLTLIDNSAFFGCTSLTQITLPDGISTIGWAAFSGCESLKEIRLPQGLTTIDSNAFLDCSSLEQIDLPEDLRSIGWGAFSNCMSLKKISVPKSLGAFDITVFSGCPVEQWELPEGHPDYTAQDGCLLSKDGKTLLFYPNVENFQVPETVTSIGESACEKCSELREVELPPQITHVKYFAFRGCENLRSVIIPEPAVSFAGYVFADCESLTDVTFPDGMKTLGDSMFVGCSSLEQIDLPAGLLDIPYGLLEGCENLTQITIPHGVTKISQGAFQNCTALKKVRIPETITEISYNAFDNCPQLELDIEGSFFKVENNVLFARGGTTLVRHLDAEVERYVMPETVTVIGNNAFQDRKALSEITLSQHISTIGSYAFRNCESLKRISLPEGVTAIGNNAFSGCINLASVQLPAGLTTLDDHAFSGCESLTGIEIPEGVTTIGPGAFENCTALVSASIPSSVEEFPYDAFNGCPQVELNMDGQSILSRDGVLISEDGTTLHRYLDAEADRYEVPDTVKVISDRAFSNCTALTEVILPEGLQSIGASAFSGCKNLQNVVFPDSVITIGDHAFYDCEALTEVVLPQNLTVVSQDVFSSCSSLTCVVLPQGVMQIKARAFSGCIALQQITIPASVNDIGNCAFSYCPLTELEVDPDNEFYSSQPGVLFDKEQTMLLYCGVTDSSYVIPDGICILGSDCFEGSEITDLTIPVSVTAVDQSAFSDYGNLRRVTYRGSAEQWSYVNIAAYNGTLLDANIQFAQ